MVRSASLTHKVSFVRGVFWSSVDNSCHFRRTNSIVCTLDFSHSTADFGWDFIKLKNPKYMWTSVFPKDGFFRLFQVVLKMMYGQVFISLISPVLIGYLMLIKTLVKHDWQLLRIGWAGVWTRALHQGSGGHISDILVSLLYDWRKRRSVIHQCLKHRRPKLHRELIF